MMAELLSRLERNEFLPSDAVSLLMLLREHISRPLKEWADTVAHSERDRGRIYRSLFSSLISRLLLNDFHYDKDGREPAVGTTLYELIRLTLSDQEGDRHSWVYLFNQPKIQPTGIKLYKLFDYSRESCEEARRLLEVVNLSAKAWQLHKPICLEDIWIRLRHDIHRITGLGLTDSPDRRQAFMLSFLVCFHGTTCETDPYPVKHLSTPPA